MRKCAFSKRVSEIEDEVLGVEDNSGSEWRRLLLAEAQTKNNLSLVLELQVLDSPEFAAY